jgi:hypothetical protein
LHPLRRRHDLPAPTPLCFLCPPGRLFLSLAGNGRLVLLGVEPGRRWCPFIPNRPDECAGGVLFDRWPVAVPPHLLPNRVWRVLGGEILGYSLRHSLRRQKSNNIIGVGAGRLADGRFGWRHGGRCGLLLLLF